jgi:hypothetical protein
MLISDEIQQWARNIVDKMVAVSNSGAIETPAAAKAAAANIAILYKELVERLSETEKSLKA